MKSLDTPIRRRPLAVAAIFTTLALLALVLGAPALAKGDTKDDTKINAKGNAAKDDTRVNTKGNIKASAAETANIKVVNDFMAAWDDPDKAVTFLAADASVRMIEDEPAVVGREAIAAVFKSFLTPGVSILIETLATTAHGPVVLNKRIDTMKTPDKPDQVFPVVGVFVVKEGQITEWTDYLDK